MKTTTTEINPFSGYDLLYKGMSDQDREKLAKDIEGILAASIKDPMEALQKAIKAAVEELHSGIVVNPWPDWINENASEYDFLNSLANHIWDSMLKAKPSKLGEWEMRAFFQSMREKHPEELSQILNEELIRENKKLKGELEFERRINRSRY